MENDNFTPKQINFSSSLLSDTVSFFDKVAKYIQCEQGPYDSVAVKLLKASQALSHLTEADVIQILYHVSEMSKDELKVVLKHELKTDGVT